jgi:gluconolactonase
MITPDPIGPRIPCPEIPPAGPLNPQDSYGERPSGESIYEELDPRFGECIDPVARLERLYSGCRWAEGPAYFADLRCLIFSDIPNRRMLRYDEASGLTSLFRAETGNANGNTRDRKGRLITCEQGARRVIRTEPDGTRTLLADTYHGKRLNSPNDVVVMSDSTVWFTDPTYGIISDFVGCKAVREIDTNNVYRVDPVSGTIDVVIDDFVMPNGLAFSPDERTLYIVDSVYLPDRSAPRHIRAFDVDRGRLRNGRVLAEFEPGIADGVRVDTGGRLWVGVGDGVHVVSPDGVLLGKIHVPEAAANLAFGGPRRDRLYITATTSLYAIFTNVTGAQHP